MGANTSSAPRIASMNNPTCPETIILISDEVASRIDGNRRQVQQPAQQSAHIPPMPMQATPAPPQPEPHICKNCNNAEKGKEEKVTVKPPPPLKPLTQTADANIFEQKSKELEKDEFEKTLKMLDKAIGKPVDWKTDEQKVEVKKLQTELLRCYKDYPKEPLRCHNNAKDYQDFVFEKQYKTILKQTLGAGDGNQK